jgi:hypothetical protein
VFKDIESSTFDLSLVSDNGYQVPLTRVNSVKANKKAHEWETILVPVVPMTFSTDAFDKADSEPLRSGWVYIYVNGYLWREFESVFDNNDEKSQTVYKEVNLGKSHGQDERLGVGAEVNELILPYKLAGDEAEVEVAFSEFQWSWDQLEAFGGMQEGDIRYKAGDKPVDLAKASDLRAERMTRVTGLGDYKSGYTSQGADEPLGPVGGGDGVIGNLYFTSSTEPYNIRFRIIDTKGKRMKDLPLNITLKDSIEMLDIDEYNGISQKLSNNIHEEIELHMTLNEVFVDKSFIKKRG